MSNTILIFGDNLGDRRLIFVLQSISSFTNFQFSYLDISKRLQKGITALRRPDVLPRRRTHSTGQIVRDRRAQRSTGGLFLFNYPLSRYHRVEANVGFISRSIDFPYVQTNADGTQNFLVTPRSDNFPMIGASFVGDTALYQEWGPSSGRRYRFSVAWAPDFSKSQIDPDHGRCPAPPRR